MDRVQVYAGQIPLETHILLTNKFAMIGVSKLAEAMLGRDNVWVTGLNCVPDPVEAFTVNIEPGQIYQLAATDATVYGGSVPADPELILKQGLLNETLQFQVPKPSSGQSIYYLISAAFVEQDDDAQVLLYYNAANPSQAFSGPNGNGAPQATTRRGKLSVQMTTGIAAASGTETVPATPAGYTALWTIRVSGNTVSVTNASSSTTDGIWKIGANHFIQFGGTGDLTQATADLRYARLNFGNTFTNRQNINFNDPLAIHIFGSSSSAGAGIKITGDGVTTPSKTIRVRGGAFGIQNDAGSPNDILLLSDTGNLSVAGTITAAGKITAGANPTNAMDVVTKQYADANYAPAGASGFITQADGDARYVRKDVGATEIQTLNSQLIVPPQPTSGTVPANQLVTQGYVDSHYASLAGSGITQTQADARYLQLAAAIPITVNTTTTFANALTVNVAPTLGNHVVNKTYADATYARLATPSTFTAAVSGIAPTADAHFVTRGYMNANALLLGGGAQSVTKQVTFTQPCIVPNATLGTHAVNLSQVQSLISTGQGITQAFADGRYGQLAGINSWSGSNTFSNTVTCLTNATNNNHLITLGRAQQLFATLAGPTFTAVPKGPGGSSSEPTGYVTWQQVFGGGGGGFATLGANSFTGTQTITPASGPNIVLGTNPGGLTGITFPGGGQFGILNSTSNLNVVSPSGAALFVVNMSTGTISNAPTGSCIIGNNLTVGGTGSFGGAVAVGSPTSGSHAVRQDQFVHGGNINSGSLRLPNGYIINWGTVSGVGTSNKFVSFHQPYTSSCLALVTSTVTGGVTSGNSPGTSGFNIAATTGGTTARFISIGR